MRTGDWKEYVLSSSRLLSSFVPYAKPFEIAFQLIFGNSGSSDLRVLNARFDELREQIDEVRGKLYEVIELNVVQQLQYLQVYYNRQSSVLTLWDTFIKLINYGTDHERNIFTYDCKGPEIRQFIQYVDVGIRSGQPISQGIIAGDDLRLSMYNFQLIIGDVARAIALNLTCFSLLYHQTDPNFGRNFDYNVQTFRTSFENIIKSSIDIGIH